MVVLPDRTESAEDAFVAAWSDSDDTDALIATIEAAMAARRPKLAARLVGLLDEHVTIEPGTPLDRARRAAALLLAQAPRPEDNSWSELEEAWTEAHRSRIKWVRRRMRRRYGADDGRAGRRRR